MTQERELAKRLYESVNDWRARLFAVLPTIPTDYLEAILSVLRVVVGEIEGELGRRAADGGGGGENDA